MFSIKGNPLFLLQTQSWCAIMTTSKLDLVQEKSENYSIIEFIYISEMTKHRFEPINLCIQ